jgi:uncharacterized repeat protein (TIGR03803 family)
MLNPKDKWKERVLYSFCALDACADGQDPESDLLLDPNGNLYGNTPAGGSLGHGTLFELSPDARGKWKERVLYNFCQLDRCLDGDAPRGHLLMDSTGALYGTTAVANGEAGNVFMLTPRRKEWRETILYGFCQLQSCTDGYGPVAGMISDSSGNLLGTTAFGGMNAVGAGTVFELSGADHKEHTILYSFCSANDCSDGAFPEAPIIMDASGHLYGTTSGGVGSARGSVFELLP